jgi:hypothetical protein
MTTAHDTRDDMDEIIIMVVYDAHRTALGVMTVGLAVMIKGYEIDGNCTRIHDGDGCIMMAGLAIRAAALAFSMTAQALTMATYGADDGRG